jgi:hypothetical protein
MSKVTAIEALKTFAASESQMVPDLPGLMRRAFDDKGFDSRLAGKLGRKNVLGAAFKSLVLGELPGKGPIHEAVFDYIAPGITSAKPAAVSEYFGAVGQVARIDRALANSGHRNTPDGKVHGEGATTHFTPELSAIRNYVIDKLSDTPIAIIGQGAAGILVRHALTDMGFGNIQTFDKSRNTLGIWSYDHVAGGTKNNPRAIHFYNRKFDAAPGPGRDISRFLEQFNHHDSYYGNKGVKSVVPGTLKHEVTADRSPSTYPIVINAIGLGKPRPLSDRSRMVTSSTAQQCGPRWQQQLSRDDVRGKRFVFVGLGNSTAEMLRQLHTFMDDGIDTDYRVVTHYPEDSVWDPRSYVEHDGKLFRVFRDLSKLNLTDFQGDLPESQRDYYRALHGKKVIYGVKRWETVHSTFAAFNSSDRKIMEVKYDKIFTLTGYEQDEASITSMGCKYDSTDKCPMYDYDGEFIANPQAKGGDRLYKGYFGLGAMLDAPHNRNAVVIPGILHRLGDLCFGVLMRANEYNSLQKE